MKIDVLDKGYIEVVDKLGDDLTPVNAARVSFGGRSEDFTDKDKRLSKFLMKHKHFSPFRHQHVMMIIKAPEFVLRQWYKHVVGIETTSTHSTKDHAWNEISGRYVEVEDFYFPEVWRKQSEDNKQASEGVLDELQQKRMTSTYNEFMRQVEMAYDRMIDAGMAKEQARIILPLNQYTEVYWTASFQSIMNFIELRNEKTSQWEIQEYAKALLECTSNTFPKITEIWAEAHGWED